jgi:hypothetical protein
MRNIVLFGGLLGAALISGCSSDHVRSKVWVVSINDTAGLASDVHNLGEDRVPSNDDFVLEDVVQVEIIADALPGSFIRGGGPYNLVTIESYDVVFESSEEIDGFSAALGWNVEVNTIHTGNLTLVPAGLKLLPPLAGLTNGGEIRTNARITFHARESESDNRFTFQTSLPVNFANWTDPQ